MIYLTQAPETEQQEATVPRERPRGHGGRRTRASTHEKPFRFGPSFHRLRCQIPRVSLLPAGSFRCPWHALRGRGRCCRGPCTRCSTASARRKEDTRVSSAVGGAGGRRPRCPRTSQPSNPWRQACLRCKTACRVRESSDAFGDDGAVNGSTTSNGRCYCIERHKRKETKLLSCATKPFDKGQQGEAQLSTYSLHRLNHKS